MQKVYGPMLGISMFIQMRDYTIFDEGFYGGPKGAFIEVGGRNPKRCVYKKVSFVHLVLGKDMCLHQVVGIVTKKFIFWHFRNMHIIDGYLRDWLGHIWKLIMGYVPYFIC